MTLLSTTLADAGDLRTSTEFDRLATLIERHDGTFTVDLPDEWSSLIGIHGGYMTSLAVLAAELRVPDRVVRTVSTSFERAGQPGAAEIDVEEVRRGRSMSTVDVRIRQDGRALIATRLTMLTEQSGIEWNQTAPIALPPPADCIPIESPVPSSHFDRAVALLDPSSIPFTAGPRAIVRGYVRPLEPRPIDAAWLAMASDWFPPPAFVRVDAPVGGISVDLLTHVHRTLPRLDDDWLTAEFEISTSTGGLATEHGRIAMLDGRLLAESIQTRWTATA